MIFNIKIHLTIYHRKEVKTLYYITYSNETVVYNSDGEKIVACPTEQEAIEYIDNYLTT